MAADRAASHDIAKQMAESNARMVQAATDVARSLCNQGNQGMSSEPKMQSLQLRDKELDIKMKELKVAKQEHESKQLKLKASAFEQAAMMQDFLKAGLKYNEAMSATITWLGPQTQTEAAGKPNSASQGLEDQEGASQA
jgi:hypothetical protein